MGEAKVKTLTFVSLIQKGVVSDVWKVRSKRMEDLVLKITKKVKLSNKNALNMVLNEKRIMEVVYSPFLANLVTTFQDRENLYLLVEYMPNGNLR